MTIERIVSEAIRRENMDENDRLDMFKYNRNYTAFTVYEKTPKAAIKNRIQRILDTTPLPTIVFQTRKPNVNICLYQTYDLLGFHNPKSPNYHKVLYSIDTEYWGVEHYHIQSLDEAVDIIHHLGTVVDRFVRENKSRTCATTRG